MEVGREVKLCYMTSWFLGAVSSSMHEGHLARRQQRNRLLLHRTTTRSWLLTTVDRMGGESLAFGSLLAWDVEEPEWRIFGAHDLKAF